MDRWVDQGESSDCKVRWMPHGLYSIFIMPASQSIRVFIRYFIINRRTTFHYQI
jgi:hypothetical protein